MSAVTSSFDMTCILTIAAMLFILQATKIPIRSLAASLFSEPAQIRVGSTGLQDI